MEESKRLILSGNWPCNPLPHFILLGSKQCPPVSYTSSNPICTLTESYKTPVLFTVMHSIYSRPPKHREFKLVYWLIIQMQLDRTAQNPTAAYNKIT